MIAQVSAALPRFERISRFAALCGRMPRCNNIGPSALNQAVFLLTELDENASEGFSLHEQPRKNM